MVVKEDELMKCMLYNKKSINKYFLFFIQIDNQQNNRNVTKW